MSTSDVEPHITKKYEIKKRLGKGVCSLRSSIIEFYQILSFYLSICPRKTNPCHDVFVHDLE